MTKSENGDQLLMKY